MNDGLYGSIYGTPTVIKAATASIGSPVHTVGTGLSDITSAGTFTDIVDHVYTIKVTTAGATDAFEVSVDGGSFGSSTNMTGSAQTIGNGVTITFAATTGHTLNDQWTVTVSAGKVINPNSGQGRLGALHRIVVNAIGSGATIALYDGTSSAGTPLGTLSGTLTVESIHCGYELHIALYVAVYASSTYPNLTFVTS